MYIYIYICIHTFIHIYTYYTLYVTQYVLHVICYILLLILPATTSGPRDPLEASCMCLGCTFFVFSMWVFCL